MDTHPSVDSSCDGCDFKSIEPGSNHRYEILLKVFILVTCVKIILIPTYHSTDFEVHRNWLAITHSLPVNEWYTNDKSQWTLDYPPFFAWFEYILSQFAKYADSNMLRVDNLNYASYNTKLFQRATVMLTDLFYLYGIKEVGDQFCESDQSFTVLAILSVCNIGLIVIDHIHFQYNGFLLGILLLSIAKIVRSSKEKQILAGVLWFSILLNLKHIYLYVAPAYGVWLLKNYCLKDGHFLYRFTKLAIIAMFVLCLSFGPFCSQLPQVLSRLFPFKRGLVHSYWAANVWAIYACIDKVLTVILKKFGVLSNVKVASMTGGLVQEDSFIVLPTPTPVVTFLITILLLIPIMWSQFFNSKFSSDPKKFIKCVVLCGLTSFMFGWHVHEKAILTAIIPLCVLAAIDKDDARAFLLLSSAGHTALFPLLYPNELTPLKLILWFTYLNATLLLFKNRYGSILVNIYEIIYIAVLPVITVYETVLHQLIFKDKLPFLPLALTSTYCALGISYIYLTSYYEFVCSHFKETNTSSYKKIEKLDSINESKVD
ncbi:hypothetical protein QAD02_011791 [Eretmocerus hayati]|uniref:Uncharacterized protein n=1 Tax=Eretmocerus hayati TaxID=131215 RepID=A0ACC2P2K6_9HYME|nr:hypothetical protein QAD02_011791 [Eretmocerus hayati]